MITAPFCAAADWGTTNFRLWLLDASGGVLAERSSGQGMRTCLPDHSFNAVIEEHLKGLDAPADLPVVVTGMAGARGAWKEAAYLDTPAQLDALHAKAVRVEEAQRDVRILPGVCQRRKGREDVMRGEETQLAGACAEGRRSGLFCLPGTHSKWVRLQEGRLTEFTTFMTGELFALMTGHSVLADMIAKGTGDSTSPAFADAVSEMLGGTALTGRLFSIRAASLLANDAPDARARLSGLLIGAEIAATREALQGDAAATLIASGAQAGAYETALSVAGVGCGILDGHDLVRRGLYSAALALWPERSAT
ncbi:2-dehydro-3-deoxygalactonokinase [Chelativorans sp. YIM 93263]|uniref:2-dehydro-3-deoxygalactonokinase n=1 Tax=Chelativorans sp. YIM 93263 TaxID=2906648 RepID=UPI002378A745|nr:2-dehydro-3-deoxygalactonokinase [Chelativorans sp. YIM 93263]